MVFRIRDFLAIVASRPTLNKIVEIVSNNVVFVPEKKNRFFAQVKPRLSKLRHSSYFFARRRCGRREKIVEV